MRPARPRQVPRNTLGHLSAAVACLALAGCSASSRPADAPKGSSPSLPGPTPIVFIDDDYPRALAEAKAQRRPIFVDAWAPWCHTCLSLRAYVLHDPKLEAISQRFVWLAIDTEKASNAAFVEKFPLEAWPTLWVIDPATERPVLKWPGTATAEELVSLLGDAEGSSARGDAGATASAAFLRGSRAAAARQTNEAVEAFRASIAAAPAGWPKRPRVVEALVTQLSFAKNFPECTETARRELPGLPAGTSRATVALLGLDCARASTKGSPSRADLAPLAAIVARIAADKSQPILADDRSGLYESLVGSLKESGETAEAKRVAASWASFLEAEAARAPTPAGRAVFDAHRLLAYIELGEAQRALPMLAQAERDFPDDYNPPARIALASLELRRFDEALTAVKRALAKAYGPRKLRIYVIEADILGAKGDKASAKATLEEAVRYGKALTLTGGYAKLLESLKKRLAGAP